MVIGAATTPDADPIRSFCGPATYENITVSIRKLTSVRNGTVTGQKSGSLQARIVNGI
jgi:hypothetical protein